MTPKYRSGFSDADGKSSCFVVWLSSRLSVQGYDYLLTVQREADLVWRSNWSLVKILFFLTRYSAFVDVVLDLSCEPIFNPTHLHYTKPVFRPRISENECQDLSRIIPDLTVCVVNS